MTQHYVHQHLKADNNRLKSRYNCLASSAGYHEIDQFWSYQQNQTSGNLPKLQASWRDPYMVVIRIKVVVYRVQ
jgi:hypothetical protein